MIRLSNVFRVISSILVFVFSLSSLATGSENKKIIVFGGFPGTVAGGIPCVQYIKNNNNIDKFNKLPFDGVVFNISNRVGYLPDRIFCDAIFEYTDILEDVRTFKKMNLINLKYNFVRMNISPAEFDWYDDIIWRSILNKISIVAMATKESGAVGIMFDTEQYSHQPFNYMLQKHRLSRTFEEYRNQVRKRGVEIIKAMERGYPGLTVYMTFSISANVSSNAPEYVKGNGLFPALLDGMMEGSKEANFIDGYEGAYGYKEYQQFVKTRDEIKNSSAFLSMNPELYKKKISVSFGLFPVGSDKFDKTDFTNNSFTPEELKHAVYYAISNADEYVWLYGGGMNWFELPEEYNNAIKDGRNPQPLDFSPRKEPKSDKPVGYIISAKGRPYTEDKVAFAAHYLKYKELFDFPKRWKFRLDPDNVGVERKWYSLEYDNKDWRDIEIGDWWEPQINHIYYGYAWYKIDFDVPGDWKNKKLLLVFGAIDEEGEIYLNGDMIHEHKFGQEGWNMAVDVDITGKVKLGQSNRLVVKVFNSAGVGGIWKSVKIFEN